MRRKKKTFIIGFDLGATKMCAAALDPKFRVLVRCRQKTLATTGQSDIYNRLKGCIEELLNTEEVKGSALAGIGVGSPGPLDPETGTIIDTPNFNWKQFPLGKRLRKDFGVPVAVDNDVNLGTYGEFLFGAGRGYQNVIGIFPGTGIGGGLILDGKLYHGSGGNAGELGHITVQVDGPKCGCGNRGCLEAVASRIAIAREVAALAIRGEAPNLLKLAGTDLANMRSGLIARAIALGDEEVEEVVRRAGTMIGVAMGSLVNIFNPDAFVLGGGLIEKLARLIVPEAKKGMKCHSFPFLNRKVKVHAAELGDDATVMGAAALISERLRD